MAASKSKIGIYSIVGITAAIIIIASFFLSGIQLPWQQPNTSNNPNTQTTGTLIVSIKDAPVDLKQLLVTIDGIYVQSESSNSWIELALDDGQTSQFDLLSLQLTSKQLTEAELSTGTYSKIRLNVQDATAVFPDDTTQTLRVPPGHIDIIIKFTITQDAITNILIDMQPDTLAISHSGNFKPTIKATATNADATQTTAQPSA
jgi:hypothetical protein